MRRCAILVVLVLLMLPAARARAGKGIDGVVNLNTAPAAALSLLPGVGPAKADAIVTYRKRRPFRTVDELVRIKGIGRKMVRRLRGHLAIAGPTTATAAAAKPAAGAPAAPAKPVPRPVSVHARGAPHCPPPRPAPRASRAVTRPHRPFASPCLDPR